MSRSVVVWRRRWVVGKVVVDGKVVVVVAVVVSSSSPVVARSQACFACSPALRSENMAFGDGDQVRVEAPRWRIWGWSPSVADEAESWEEEAGR